MGAQGLDLSRYIDPSRVLILDEPISKSSLLKLLSCKIAQSDIITDPDLFHQAILEREGVTSTAIGSGIAIPHARHASIRDFLMAVAITPQGVDYGARDGLLVQITIMIASPEDERARHLQMLAHTVGKLAAPSLRDIIVKTTDPVQIIRLLT